MFVKRVFVSIVIVLMFFAFHSKAGNTQAARSAGTQYYYPSYDFRFFEIGIRSYQFKLRDTLRVGANGADNANGESGINFVGNVWELKEIQNDLPRMYAQVTLNPYVGFGMAYDYLGAKTVAWGNAEKTRTATEGDLSLQGALFYVLLRYPLMLGITPFCELGGAWYFADFSEDAAWAAAAPGRRFKVDSNTFGYEVGLGVDVAISADWSVNLYWRQTLNTKVHANVNYSEDNRDSRSGSLPMEARAIGLGVSYHF